QAYDPDSSAIQVQYALRALPKYGDLYLGGTKLGVGSSFTQQDVHDGKLRYVHRGGDVNAADSRYDDRFTFELADGDKETGGEFWILVEPTNDAPVVKVPDGPIRPDAVGINNVPVSVSDPDLGTQPTDIDPDHDVDFVHVTVRLKD